MEYPTEHAGHTTAVRLANEAGDFVAGRRSRSTKAPHHWRSSQGAEGTFKFVGHDGLLHASLDPATALPHGTSTMQTSIPQNPPHIARRCRGRAVSRGGGAALASRGRFPPSHGPLDHFVSRGQVHEPIQSFRPSVPRSTSIAQHWVIRRSSPPLRRLCRPQQAHRLNLQGLATGTKHVQSALGEEM